MTRKDAYRDYSRAKSRLVSATETFTSAEKAYINALLEEQDLKIGDLVQTEDGKTVIRLEEVVIDNGNGILSGKGPVRKKDGSISDGQRRNVFAVDGRLTPYVD